MCKLETNALNINEHKQQKEKIKILITAYKFYSFKMDIIKYLLVK